MNVLRRAAALASITVLVSGCAGVFGGLHQSPRSTPTPSGTGPTPVPTGTGGPVSEAAFRCPTSDSARSVARSASSSNAIGPDLHRLGSYPRTAEAAPGVLAVDYDANTFAKNRERLTSRELAVGATLVREFDFAHTGIVTRVVRTQTGSGDVLAGALRAISGVRSVAPAGRLRHPASVTAPLLTNDPYFQGFGDAAPLYETAGSEGQWDMHVSRLEYAFAYSSPHNGSSATNAAAIGSPKVKVAILDTGVDTGHLDLVDAAGKSKVVYQKCFVTDPNLVQSTSNFETDPTGHGTFVAGMAAAEPNNGFGFSGAGGAVSIDAYRIYPTPDDTCATNSPDAQCFVNTMDVASAIEDAVTQHAGVINLSFGSGACAVAGVDDDPVEGNAVADAIAANVVVVAAAGDDGTGTLEAPACDTGVIAVGATGLSDGSTNGSNNTSGSATAPREYVPSYSDQGSPGTIKHDATAWGLVAPGGDPSSANDLDNLHFIENLWTSTPAITAFAATCTSDGGGSGGAMDCHAFDYGTSVSAPIVAGAAALVLSVSGKYQSATAMKELLCGTADDIGSKSEGCGRLDIYRAMAVAVKDQFPPSARPIP